MTDKQQQKLVVGAGQKFRGQRSNFSQCYVDFKNPEHGFTVIDLTCSFTVQKILDRYCVARIRKDPLIARELDHLLEVWKEEDKNGRKRFRGVKGKGKQQKAPSDSQPNGPEEEEEEEGDETDVRINYVSPNIQDALARVEEDEEEGIVSEEDEECSEEFPATRAMPNDKETRAVLALIDAALQSKTSIVPVALSSSSSSNDHSLLQRTSSSSSSSTTQRSKKTKVVRIEDEMN